MKVIILKHVPKVGNAGDIKEVSEGYFRNFLMLRGLAKPATKGALKEAEKLKAEAGERSVREHAEGSALLEKLKQEHLVIHKKANEEGNLFGSVSEEDIAKGLYTKGYKQISKDHVTIEMPIKSLGSYAVVVKLGHDLQGAVSLTVEKDFESA